MSRGETYEEFTEKFKQKKTTDDCYTPPAVYDVVLEYVVKRYDIKPDTPICRPFYPGGDYQNYEYTEGCIVVDNPPFSILSEIVRWYVERGIGFFLFAPGLTCMGHCREISDKICKIFIHDDITYNNGAKVRTAFITNLEPDLMAFSDPELSAKIKQSQPSKQKPKTNIPEGWYTGSEMMKACRRGEHLEISKGDYEIVSKNEEGKAIYGSAMKPKGGEECNC